MHHSGFSPTTVATIGIWAGLLFPLIQMVMPFITPLESVSGVRAISNDLLPSHAIRILDKKGAHRQIVQSTVQNSISEDPLLFGSKNRVNPGPFQRLSK